MAEPLAGAGIGHNLSRASFLDFCVKHSEIERELAEVAETRRSLNRRRKDLRKGMGAAGIDLEMFDRVLLDVELIPEERVAQARAYQQMMEWRQAPVGFQPSMDLQTDDPGLRAYNAHELHAIDGEGYDSGRAGHPAHDNPHRPGTEAHQRWQGAWIRGQAAAVAATSGTGPAPRANGAIPADAAAEIHRLHTDPTGDTPAPKRRGRPPGSGKKAAATAEAEPHTVARIAGYDDGLAGVLDHAARYPQGAPGHGDYMLGVADGEAARAAPEGAAAEGAPAPQEA
jgi:hypothetical protein